jgi:hypothetical protein
MKSIQATLTTFVNQCLRHASCASTGRSREANRSYHRILDAFARLKEHGDAGRDALIPLLSHEAVPVRLWAAAILLRYRTGLAKAALKQLTLQQDLAGFEAEMTLTEWSKGNMDLDPVPSAGRVKVAAVNPKDVGRGCNWRLVEGGSQRMTDWIIEPLGALSLSDTVAYSGAIRLDDGRVLPILMFKVAGDAEWWGDTVVHWGGRWRTDVPKGRVVSEECVASPFPSDPSFSESEAQRNLFVSMRECLRL